MQARFFVVAVVVLGCGRREPQPEPIRAAPDPAEPAQVDTAPAPPAAPGPSCPATRPFAALASAAEQRLALPAPFAGFDACDVLSAIHPDYERQAEKSTQARGTVRADKAFVVRSAGRALLAVTRYAGEDAEQGMMCGCCTAKARVALLEPRDGRLGLVADADEPIEHGGLNDGVTLTPAQLPLRDGEELLTLDAAHSCGTSPGRHYLHGFRLEGATLRQVLAWRVAASGIGAGADRFAVTATPSPRKGKGDVFDLAFEWTRARCPYDEHAGDFVCKPGDPLGTELLRFDGRNYRPAGNRLRVELFD